LYRNGIFQAALWEGMSAAEIQASDTPGLDEISGEIIICGQ
jgi:hypothetical protein